MNPLSWVEINTAHIRYNVHQIKFLLSPKTKIAAVIKSNAYGHGMIPMASFLQKNGLVDYLAVANDQEALTLRKHNITLPLIILSYWDIKNLHHLVNHNIDIPVYNISQLKALTFAQLTKPAKVHLKLDTGMHRLGLYADEFEKYVNYCINHNNIKLQGIFSHLAVADDNWLYTKKQIMTYNKIIAKIDKHVKMPLLHLANSAAALSQTNSHFSLVRVGIAMYGLQPSIKYFKTKLKPVLSWKTRVLQVKNIKAGERLGYGLTYKFIKSGKIAIVAIGYADGYDRGLSNCGFMIIKNKNKICPVRGRVCMNLTALEVDGTVHAGDEVTIIGPAVSADFIAAKLHTIHYEVVSRISNDIKRVFI